MRQNANKISLSEQRIIKNYKKEARNVKKSTSGYPKQTDKLRKELLNN